MSSRILLIEDEPGLVLTLSDLLEAEGLMEQMVAFSHAFYNAAFPSKETETPERTSERAKNGKWINWLKGRNGD